MKVIRGLENLKTGLKGSVVTIGVFDGVHIGHRRIIKDTVARAGKAGAKSVVLTFEPHPAKILNPGPGVPTIISLEHRIRIIGSLGVDYLVIAAFTKKLGAMTPEEFVKKVLLEKLSAKELLIGGNFYFGRGARTGAEGLKRLARKMGFRVKVLKPVRRGAHVVSSSLIRRLITKGDIAKAADILGRPVSVLGTVIRGRARGRILGYPTANINPHHETIPPSGVYAVRVRYKNRTFGGVLNIGFRPTFHDDAGTAEPTIEVHIFDFDKSVYGEGLEILFVARLRDEKKFRDRESLIAQIARDTRQAQNYLHIS
jgi:riboflavin kinase/FMN adenylyltransferase